MLLAQMKKALGSLDRVERIVKLGAFVASERHFTDQPKVANGASELMEKVFGEAGRHARSAVGVPVLPLGAAVEIDAIVAVKALAELARLIARPFAHRGLHGPGRIENSRAAFEAAIAAGSGIELDVQASADGEAMVFHDADLDRLTDARGALAAWSAAELGRFRLSGSDETIPTLAEILGLIGGRAPLLIEVKSPNRQRRRALPKRRRGAADLYRGRSGVMSFNPEVGAWFARHAPERLRGLVVTEQGKKGLRGLARAAALPSGAAVPISSPTTYATCPPRFAPAQRANGMPVLTWTVRTMADRARAAEHAEPDHLRGRAAG